MAPQPKPVPKLVPPAVSVQGSQDQIVIDWEQLPKLIVKAGPITYTIQVRGMSLGLVRKEG